MKEMHVFLKAELRDSSAQMWVKGDQLRRAGTFVSADTRRLIDDGGIQANSSRVLFVKSTSPYCYIPVRATGTGKKERKSNGVSPAHLVEAREQPEWPLQQELQASPV